MMLSGVYYVDAYGAMGDGVAYDTRAFQTAIDECGDAGGGKVVFGIGKSYLIGTVYLRSNVTVELPAGSEILGGGRLSDYGADTGISPYYPEPLDRCLIYAKNVKNTTLKGMGIINGGKNSDYRLENDLGASGRECEQRPMLVRFEECDNIHIEELTLKGSFSWCVHIKNCANIHLSRVNVFNDRQDGFNIESCREVLISDCNFKCGDDGIALTTNHHSRPLKDVTVTNCIISSRWAAIRLGPLSKGNFENIVVSNCIFKECNGGGIKLGMFEGAEIKNCLFSNIVMDNVTAPIFMLIGRWPDIGSTEEIPLMMNVGRISNISFSNIRGVARAGNIAPWLEEDISEQELEDTLNRPDRNSVMFFHGYPGSDIKNISLQNIDFTFPGGGTLEQAQRRQIPDVDKMGIADGGYWTDNKNLWGIMPAYGLFVRHVKGLRIRDVRLEAESPDMRPAIFSMDSEGISVSNLYTGENSCSKDNVVIME